MLLSGSVPDRVEVTTKSHSGEAADFHGRILEMLEVAGGWIDQGVAVCRVHEIRNACLLSTPASLPSRSSDGSRSAMPC